MTPSITANSKETPVDSLTFTKPEKKVSLKSIFGKVAAVIALGATIAFYALGFNIGHAYFQQWQENKAEVTQTQTWDGASQHQDRTANLPWGAAAGSFGVAIGSGLAGIALGKKAREERGEYGGYSGGYGSGYSSYGNNDNFWLGYVLGSNNSSSGSSRSSSSSSDNGGAAAAIVIVGAAALAASASVVTYKALKANFGGP